MKFARLLAVMQKELRQLRRDRLTFGMIIGIPTLQLLLFGFAINMDVRNLPAGVADLANTGQSRAITQDIAHSQVLELRGSYGSPQALVDALRRGEISVGLVIPSDLSERLNRNDRSPMQLLVDGSDPTILSAARQIASLPSPQARGTPPLFEVTPLYNPERRSAVNIVPGLIGVILTLTMVLFTSVAIVRERERGNIELLITTPLTPSELMLAKVLPYIGIGLIQTSVVLWLGVLLFKVPIRGSLFDVYLAALAFISASLTLGLMISNLARTQFQAMQVTFLTFLPQMLLSGFMFPFAGMPKAAQYLAEILPLTHFVRMIRAIMLRGAGVHELLPEFAALGLFFAITLTVAIRRFRKRLD